MLWIGRVRVFFCFLFCFLFLAIVYYHIGDTTFERNNGLMDYLSLISALWSAGIIYVQTCKLCHCGAGRSSTASCVVLVDINKLIFFIFSAGISPV